LVGFVLEAKDSRPQEEVKKAFRCAVFLVRFVNSSSVVLVFFFFVRVALALCPLRK
jgi:hypothetical protein